MTFAQVNAGWAGAAVTAVAGLAFFAALMVSQKPSVEEPTHSPTALDSDSVSKNYQSSKGRSCSDPGISFAAQSP
jgi:hypothetical protein